MGRLNKIVFVINRNKSGAEQLAGDLGSLAKSKGVSYEIITTFPIHPDAVKGMDLCVVVGGDGTLLGVTEAVSQWKVPVMGVNLGRLGFMAHFLPDEVK